VLRVVLAGPPLPSGLLEHGVEHLGDEALLASGELLELLELSLELGGGAALGGLALGAEEFLDGDAQGLREIGQGGHRHPPAPLLERQHLLLEAAEGLSELDLGQAALGAQACDPLAELVEEGRLFGADRRREFVAELEGALETLLARRPKSPERPVTLLVFLAAYRMIGRRSDDVP